MQKQKNMKPPVQSNKRRKKGVRRSAVVIAAIMLLTASESVASSLRDKCISGCTPLATTLAQQVVTIAPSDPSSKTRPRYSKDEIGSFYDNCVNKICGPSNFPSPKPQHRDR